MKKREVGFAGLFASPRAASRGIESLGNRELPREFQVVIYRNTAIGGTSIRSIGFHQYCRRARIVPVWRSLAGLMSARAWQMRLAKGESARANRNTQRSAASGLFKGGICLFKPKRPRNQRGKWEVCVVAFEKCQRVGQVGRAIVVDTFDS